MIILLKEIVTIPLKIFAPLLNRLLQKFNIFILYTTRLSAGDHVCMSAVVRMIDEQYGFKIMVISAYPEIFANNSRVWRSISLKKSSPLAQKIISFLLFGLRGTQIQRFLFFVGRYTLENYMRETKSQMHLVQVHSQHFRLPLNYKNLRPEIIFTNEEIVRYKTKFQLPPQYAIIQPVGKTTYTPNKEWGFEKFQEVVNKLPQITWIQLGLAHDKLLDGVIDFRNKTKNLREIFYVISKSSFLFVLEGLYNHIAAAFDIKSFVIFSGFHPFSIAKYTHTIPLLRIPPVECSPCWLLTPCPVKGKPCTEEIEVDYVVKTIFKNCSK